MNTIRDRLGIANNSTSSIRDRLGITNNSDDFRKQYIRDYSDYKKKSSTLKELATSSGIETTVSGSNLIPTKSPFANKIDIQKNVTQNNKFKVDDYDLEARKNRYELDNLKKTDEYKSIQNETEKAFNKQKVSNYNYEAQKNAEDNVNFWDKTGGNVTRALTGLFDMGGYELTDEYGEKYNVPSLTQLKQQKVSQSYNTKVGRFLGDTAYEMTKIGATTAINAVAPGIGTGIYFGDMYFDSKNSALQGGYDEKSATVYAISNVGLEYATGKLLGSATKGLTGGKSSNYEEVLNKTFNKLTKNSKLSNILANAGSEATEEFLQEYMDSISKLAILDKKTNIKDYISIFTDKEILADALYSAAVGGVTGGVIGTLSGRDTNVDNNDVNLYDTFKKELEETKQNTTSKETINKIDNIITEIDYIQSNNVNTSSNADITTEISEIKSQIKEYQTLQDNNQLNPNQQSYLERLENKLVTLQNQLSSKNEYSSSIPTVNDIVQQEQSKSNSSNINLPSLEISSSKVNLPTMNDFASSNINMPAGNIKIDMTKIKPEILEDIKGFKLGDPSIESYKGSYIKTMLNEVGIKVPTAMNYVSEVRPDMSFTTTKELTRQQYASIGNALQKLKNVDITSVNNANYSIPIGNYQYVRSNDTNINELRRTASMYLTNAARTNNTIKLLENIIKDRNYTIRFNPDIVNEHGVSVNGKISVENGRTIIELNPNADNYIEFLVIHEITHDIATKEMKELIFDYAEQNSEFEDSLESLKERYKTDDVSDEVVADVCGELFGNREFIQSVVEKKPSIFKKILNNIRKLAEKIKGTGANEYVNFVERLKTMWEDAYYSNQSNLTEAKYMMTGIKGIKNAIKNDSDNQFLKDNYNKALKYAENNIENEQIRKKTGWFQDSKGDWKFEISDKDAKIIKKLEKNNTYRLEEILEHDDLYEMYPNLRKNKVKFTDFDIRIDENGKRYIKKGRVNNITNTISLNNELISKGNDAILDTLMHEIQHRIQKIEKFTQGTTSANGFESYQNNFGEKEARDTTERRKMNYETRLEKLPVSSLNNSKIDKSKSKWYSLNEVEQNVQKDNTISSQNLYENIYSRGELGRNIKGQELDNSSFSNNKEWNNYLKETFPSAGTKTEMSEIKLPVREDIRTAKKNKTSNPNEISQLTKEDANTTPILPKRATSNKVNDGNSHFAKNIKDKVNMLNADQKAEILLKEEVRYYDKVTNKESLEKAFKQLNDGGSAETLRWIKQDSKNASSIDVAEGWILLKQYADNSDYDSMVEVAKKMREIGTNAGQTVQAFNIMERMTPEGMVKYAQSELSEAYDRMVKNKSKEWIDKYREDFDLKPDEVKFIMDTMKEVSEMEDGYDKKVKLAEIQKLMTDKLPPEKGAGIRAWMRISMLFNPKTQVRNVAGNALIMPINSFGDLFSSYADKLIAKKTGVRTTGATNIKAILKGMKKGAYESTNDYKKGISTRDMEGNRFEITNGKSFSEKSLIGKALNRTESLLNYVMDAGDRVFSEAAFENSLQNQMVLNNTTEITQEMIDIAHQEALSRTWNDNNNYTRFVLGVRKGLNKLNINGYGLGDVLIPFAKTPANLTKAIVDYSPAGLVSTITKGINLKRSLTNGQYTASMQHEFVQSLGKTTAGTMLYVLGIALAKAGITSGNSDDDKDTANFLKNTLGISSYSIKIGNKSFTYDWAQPLAAPLSITANIVNSRKNKEQALAEAIIGSLDTAGSILLEQSFLESLNDVLSSNDGVVSGIINEVLELPARAVPTFSKQIADMVDGTQRQSFVYDKPLESAVNNIKAKIPFVSKTLAPSVDTMGREIKKYGGKNNIFNVFLNPANVNTENISKSAEEIYRLYKKTGETDIMPRVSPYYINQDGEKITLSAEQRAEYQKVSGIIIETSIKDLLGNSKYKNMNDIEKAETINKIVNYSYNKAREKVLDIPMSDTYDKINKYVADNGKVSYYYLNKEEIDYSYNYPEKYKTITQITTYDKYLIYQDEINNVKDKYENTNQRKNAVINYVNSLELSVQQKAMLIKMNYSSFNSYNQQIIEYINNQDLTISEKTEILTKLGFTVKDGRVYSK